MSPIQEDLNKMAERAYREAQAKLKPLAEANNTTRQSLNAKPGTFRPDRSASKPLAEMATNGTLKPQDPRAVELVRQGEPLNRLHPPMGQPESTVWDWMGRTYLTLSEMAANALQSELVEVKPGFWRHRDHIGKPTGLSGAEQKIISDAVLREMAEEQQKDQAQQHGYDPKTGYSADAVHSAQQASDVRQAIERRQQGK